jgi:NADPH-dependent curcumin reductase CurA
MDNILVKTFSCLDDMKTNSQKYGFNESQIEAIMTAQRVISMFELCGFVSQNNEKKENKGNSKTKERIIAESIFDDLLDRRGIKDVICDIDDDVIEEMLDEWVNIIKEIENVYNER